MINHIISFKRIPFKKIDNSKIAQEYNIPVSDKNGYDVFVRINEDYGTDHFETSIDTIDESNLAKNQFSIDHINKLLNNGGMDVWRKSNRGKGLGVVMHLNSIMELLENNLDKIYLYSLGQAVLFHGKCKFEPQLDSMDEIMDTMYTISCKDCKKIPELKEVVKQAGDYFDEVQYSSGVNCLKPKNLEYANEIVQKYIDILSKKRLSPAEKEEYSFPIGFNMVLTKEKILENKDFFNGLYKKFNIDYEI